MWTARWKGNPDPLNETAVTIEGKVYCFSSLYICFPDVEEFSDYLIHVLTFNPISLRWDILQTQSPPNNRPINIIGRTVVAYGHYAYLWGGWHISPVVTRLYRFDARAMTWSCPEVWGEMPGTDTNHSACVVGHRMYISGGWDVHSGNSVHFLDLETFRWHRVSTSGDGPARRYCHTASAIGTRMYVWGGHLEDSSPIDCYDNSLYYLETTTATWVRPKVAGVAPEGRECHSAFVYEREVHIFGGYNDTLDTYFADIHKYSVESSSWTKLMPNGSGPSARHSPGCTALGERVFVFGGLGPPPNREDVEDVVEEEEEKALTDFYILHLAPTLQNLCMLAVIDAGLDLSDLPELISTEIRAIASR